MKKIVLMIALAIVFFLPAFSQLNSRFQTHRLQMDTTFGNFSSKNRFGTLNFGDSIELKGSFHDAFKNKNFLNPKYKYELGYKGQNLIGVTKTPLPVDNMPCLKPKGNFPMPIYKPDSSINFTLRIKQFGTNVN